MDRIVRINVTKVERTVRLNVVSNVTKIIVSQSSSGGGGGGAVDSVNGQTEVVVLDADDIAETATRVWLTDALKTVGNEFLLELAAHPDAAGWLAPSSGWFDRHARAGSRRLRRR